eukprot:12405086-Karenia_brevis.AAC.1
MQLYITKPSGPTPKEIKTPEQKDRPWSINPYYWMGAAVAVKKDGNMIMKAIEHSGYKFNVLVNFKPVAARQKLTIYDASLQAKKRKTA